MIQLPRFRLAPRAPRISLRGSVSATLQLENRHQLTSKLHRLLLTGGLMEVSCYIDERSRIFIAFPMGERLLQAKAELFFPMRGGFGFLQPFRFIAFAPGTRQTLEQEISSLVKRPLVSGYAPGLRQPRYFLDSL